MKYRDRDQSRPDPGSNRATVSLTKLYEAQQREREREKGGGKRASAFSGKNKGKRLKESARPALHTLTIPECGGCGDSLPVALYLPTGGHGGAGVGVGEEEEERRRRGDIKAGGRDATLWLAHISLSPSLPRSSE